MTVDLEAIRDEFRTELQEVERLLQPAQFQVKDPGGAAEVKLTCEMPNGEEGRSYVFETKHSVGHVDDPEAKANMIAEHWRGRGYEVEVVDELGIRVVARNDEGGFLRFVVDEPGMTFSGETGCAQV